jgi:hypothetical protein
MVVTHSCIVKRKPNISEEHITTISRVKEQGKQGTGRRQYVPLKHRAFSECHSITSVKNELSITK